MIGPESFRASAEDEVAGLQPGQIPMDATAGAEWEFGDLAAGLVDRGDRNPRAQAHVRVAGDVAAMADVQFADRRGLPGHGGRDAETTTGHVHHIARVATDPSNRFEVRIN